jgi:hypothetical protein
MDSFGFEPDMGVEAPLAVRLAGSMPAEPLLAAALAHELLRASAPAIADGQGAPRYSYPPLPQLSLAY